MHSTRRNAMIRNVSILGVGQTPVANHESLSLRSLAVRACRAAIADAGVDHVDAIFVGNMLSNEMTGQSHLGPLIGSAISDGSLECVTVNTACGSGGAVVRMASMAVASGSYGVVLAVGVEKMIGRSKDVVTRALASAADYEREVSNGATFAALNALLMQRYM
jgi:acetyl-CoA C-acetyltransferase